MLLSLRLLEETRGGGDGNDVDDGYDEFFSFPNSTQPISNNYGSGYGGFSRDSDPIQSDYRQPPQQQQQAPPGGARSYGGGKPHHRHFQRNRFRSSSV